MFNKKQTKELFNIDLDDVANASTNIPNSKSSQSQLKTNPLSNVNIRVPDIISNATRPSDYSRLNENDESDYEIDIARIRNQNSANNTTNSSFRKNDDDALNYRSLQMQHEVNKTIFKLNVILFVFLNLIKKLFREQDKNLDMLSTGVSNLKNISQTMQMELDDQANLIDDLGREMDVADGRMQQTMKKITKLLHMDNGKSPLDKFIMFFFFFYVEHFSKQRWSTVDSNWCFDCSYHSCIDSFCYFVIKSIYLFLIYYVLSV